MAKEMIRGTLVCRDCGQTKQMYLPKGVIPDLEAEWHKCDPANVHSPERLVSNDVLRTLTHIAGTPLRIGGISAEDSAFNDVKRRSTKKI
jgi:hypothetical protein